jgi:hypothetical protein
LLHRHAYDIHLDELSKGIACASRGRAATLSIKTTLPDGLTPEIPSASERETDRPAAG